MRPVVVATKRPADGGKYRGGVTNWGQVERELLNLCGDGGATVTSMIDLYALPIGTPTITAEIDLQGLRGACPHSSDWISALESRARRE